MWSRSQRVAGTSQNGNTQWLSRRVTRSRIHRGGSWASTASVRAMSRTGSTVTEAPVSQPRIFSTVAGPRPRT